RIGILTADLHQTQAEQADIDDLLVRIQALDHETAPPPDEVPAAPEGDPVTVAAEVPDDAPAVAPPIAPETDEYEEEHDEELFGIFLEQLQEGLEALQSWTDALPGAEHGDRIELMGRCLGQIDPLRSSANYMGYRKLTALYDRWNEAIQTARERLGNAEDHFLPAFIAGCMQATIDDISRCFPRLEHPAAASHAMADEEARPDSQTAAEATALAPPDLLDAYAEAPDTAPDQDSGPAPAVPIAEGDDLFDRLSRSFDHRMAEHQAPAPDTFSSGMAFELFSEDPPQNDRDHETASPTTDDGDVEDPLTAYVDAPETPAAESPSTDQAEALKSSSPADSTPIAPPLSADLPGEKTSGEIPAMVAEASLATMNRPIQEPEPSPQTITEDPDITPPPSDDIQTTEPATTSDPSDTDAPPTPPVSAETLLANREQRTGDRRDSVRRGRRKSDRINERLLKQSIRVDAGKIDDLMNQVGELVVSRAWFSQLFHEMRDLQQNLQHRARLESREMKQVKGLTFRLSEATVALGRVANELQEGVMKVRMLPIAQLFNRYPRLVFDLVRDGRKKVQLDIKGEETELDKMVIEAISDPLIHIIRNAVDHGIETAAERKKRGKPESGTICLEAYHEGNHVVIEITDDGQGLDIDRIKAKASAGGFASAEELERMSRKELTGLIMQPGFSTAAAITHTSGRGVGMDVVKKNIEKLNGTIEIDSKPGIETRFRIKIPLTLAIIPALLVQVRGELFTIPLSTVEETIRISPEDLSTIEGVEVMQLRESTLPLVRLADLFNMPTDPSSDGRAFVVVVSTGMKRVGLVVDVLLGQEEVVIKPLEDYLQEKSGFSGATILGDGRISLILDIYELVNLSIDRQAQRKQVGTPV
ncbi:MAG: chemotaxis protein CheA, partial [Desulfobacteraceae bacterium]|nr:chemotaxis protein CheA [Desulfobacteraceae bacterium]MBC2750129.1 chemotaxis protein CheA [Desulfobacteraceae bacterium]